jgi:hypothetical protein
MATACPAAGPAASQQQQVVLGRNLYAQQGANEARQQHP